MTKKKILFVTMYFYPEIDSSQIFLTRIKKELFNRGCDITTVVPNPVRDLDTETINKYKSLKCEQTDCGDIVRLYVNSDSSNSIFTRAKRFIGFQRKLKKYLKKNIKNFDLVYFISNPPIFVPLLIEKICKKNKVETIYEIDDVFPEITKKYSFLKPFAHKAIKNCNHIITLSEDMKDTISKWTLPTCKIDVVTIWPSAYSFNNDDLNKIKNFYNCNKFYVSYIGNIGHFQNIDLFLDIAKQLQGNEEIGFIIGGFGRNLEKTLQRINNENITNIKYIGKLSPSEALACYTKSDINIISLTKNAIRFACPSKTTMCMLANKRTLLLIDKSRYSDTLMNNKNFIIDDSFNSEIIADKIVEELSLNHNPIQYDFNFDKCFEQWVNLFFD